jgi:hypothetical protein
MSSTSMYFMAELECMASNVIENFNHLLNTTGDEIKQWRALFGFGSNECLGDIRQDRLSLYRHRIIDEL